MSEFYSVSTTAWAEAELLMCMMLISCIFFLLGSLLSDEATVTRMSKKSKIEKHKFSGTNQKPERRRPFGTGLVRQCPQGSSRRSLLFFVPHFSACLHFPSSPISAPGSPRMYLDLKG